MKKLLLALALALLLCPFTKAANAFDVKGSAVAPGIRSFNFSATSNDQTELAITNISNTLVTCKVTVFDQNGNDISSKCNIYSGLTVIANGGGPFELPAGNTRLASIWIGNESGVIYGHAVIEWGSADSNLRKALIATVRTWGRNGSTSAAGAAYLNVNGGQPF